MIRQPKLLPAKWEVTELDENRKTFTWVTRSPGVRVVARHSVEDSRGQSRATLSIRFSGPFGPFFVLGTAAVVDARQPM